MNHIIQREQRFAILLALACTIPVPARAQTVDPQRALTAQALYEQATAEMDARKFADACRKLEEVTRLIPEGLGAKLTLGQCYEAQDKLASAWSQYALVQEMATKVGQEARAMLAGGKAAALKPQLATITIEVPDTNWKTLGLTVSRDGLSIGEPQWGTPLPVDAGSHEIVAKAPGRETYKKQLEVVANGARVTVKIPRLRLDQAAAAGTATAEPSSLPVTAPQDRGWQRPVGLAVTLTGTVGVGAALVLGAVAIFKHGESKEGNHCDLQDRCDDKGLALRREALDLGNGSTAAFIVGTAVLVGGAALLLSAPPSRGAPQGAPVVRVSLGMGGARVQVLWD